MTNPGFLSGYVSAVPLAQREAINSLMNERRRLGFIVDKMQLIADTKDKLEVAKLNGKLFSYNPIYPGQKISSEQINKMFEDIFVDLKTLYMQIGAISSVKNRITTATTDDFIKTKAAILDAITQLRLFDFLKKNPEYQDAKYIDFINAINNTAYSPKAIVDNKVKKLKLPANINRRYSSDRFNLDFATADVKIYGGGISSGNIKGFSIENTLDADPDNFWATTVLADGQPSHKVVLSHSYERRKIGSGTQTDTVYESNGIVFELTYSFSKTIHINNLRLLPIADFPVKVLDLSYKTSDSSETWTTLPGFDPLDYEETLDWLEWNGKRSACVAIRIVLEQQNYTSNIYQIPSDMVSNNQLWHQIIDGSYNELFHSIELDQVIADKIALNEQQIGYLNEVSEVSKDILKTKLTGRNIKEYEIIDSVKATLAAHLGKANSEESSSYINTYMQKNLVSKKKLVEIKKLQYTCGLRFVEFNDITYQPFGYYESPKFESNANILEVSLDTDEEHQDDTDAITGERFRKTSIEYEIQLSNALSIPILPVGNLFDAGTYQAARVTDERVIVSRRTYSYLTRFPIPAFADGTPGVQIRKNGRRLPPIVINSGYRGTTPEYNYTIGLEVIGSYTYIRVNFNSKYFDPRAIYTISYIADESCCIVDINALVDSEATSKPEEFKNTDKNNSVKINYYPYTEYEIVNNDTTWAKVDDEQKWLFTPYLQNYSKGTVTLNTGSPYFVSGNSTSWATTVSGMVSTTYNGISGASLRIQGDKNIYPISGVISNSGMYLMKPISTGFLPSGMNLTGLTYSVSRTTEVDGVTYGFDNIYYEPNTVYVNDVKAKNLTNYETLEHDAFSTHDGSSKVYEYLQAGRNIYFNAPINGKIEVNYRHLTQYIKLNAILRSNTQLNPADTPVLNNYTIMIKNSKI
jgi:hypothetical protein